jgi:hypothetical protein
MKACLILAVAAAGLASEPARADALQDQVLAAARTIKPAAYRFLRTIATSATGNEQRTFVEQFDPRKPANEQWTLLSVNGQAPTAKQLASARKARREPMPGYFEQIKWFGGAATRADSAPGSVTYRFASLPKGTLKIGSHDASADTQAEVLVNTRGRAPFVEAVRMTTTKSFSMMLVASVKSVVISYNYAALDDGQVMLTGTTSQISGSMMGKSGEMRTTMTLADYQPAR